MRIKYAKNLLKGNLCAAVMCVILPVIMYLTVKFAEQIIRRYFFPLYQADIREIIILLVAILLHFMLMYPLIFAKKLCFYANCTKKRIPLFGVFCCYGSLRSFCLAALTVLLKNTVTFLLCGIMILPSFWAVRLALLGGFDVCLQIAAVLLAISAVYFSAVIIYSLFLTEYIAVQTGKNPFYCMLMSIRLMRKNRSKLLLLKLKLLPYLLMCLGVIPIFYVLPLYSQTTALFAHDIIFYSPLFVPASSTDI